MQQTYYCTNCGTPVVCGENYCTGCGIHFQWITQAELEQYGQVSYSLPTQEQQTSGQQPLLNQRGLLPQQAQPGSTTALEKRVPHAGDTAGPLSTNISKLLESFFDKRAKCGQG